MVIKILLDPYYVRVHPAEMKPFKKPFKFKATNKLILSLFYAICACICNQSVTFTKMASLIRLVFALL